MVRIAVRVACFLTFGCCQRNQWVLPKEPLGAAEETIGCRRGNQWVPWEKPVVSAKAPAGNRIHTGTEPLVLFSDGDATRVGGCA